MSAYVINTVWMVLENVLKTLFTFLFHRMVAKIVSVADYWQ